MEGRRAASREWQCEEGLRKRAGRARGHGGRAGVAAGGSQAREGPSGGEGGGPVGLPALALVWLRTCGVGELASPSPGWLDDSCALRRNDVGSVCWWVGGER